MSCLGLILLSVVFGLLTCSEAFRLLHPAVVGRCVPRGHLGVFTHWSSLPSSSGSACSTAGAAVIGSLGTGSKLRTLRSIEEKNRLSSYNNLRAFLSGRCNTGGTGHNHFSSLSATDSMGPPSLEPSNATELYLSSSSATTAGSAPAIPMPAPQGAVMEDNLAEQPGGGDGRTLIPSGGTRLAGKFLFMYTCKLCQGRNVNMVSKLAYYTGMVVSTCTTCKVRHWLADNEGRLDMKEYGKRIDEYIANNYTFNGTRSRDPCASDPALSSAPNSSSSSNNESSSHSQHPAPVQRLRVSADLLRTHLLVEVDGQLQLVPRPEVSSGSSGQDEANDLVPERGRVIQLSQEAIRALELSATAGSTITSTSSFSDTTSITSEDERGKN